MSEIIRTRTVRPSSRHVSSNNYRIDTSTIKRGDTLLVNIYHESKPFLKSYRFNWKQVIGRNITFSTKEKAGSTVIKWNKIKPIELDIERKILLCRIAWMKHYEGQTKTDIPVSGAKYIVKNKSGGEIYNFKNRNGNVFGYFPFINSPSIQNLGAERNAESVKDITVVFCAKHPKERGIRVVGWYKKATVYAYSANRGDTRSYHASAKFKDVTKISANDRIFRVPDLFGRSSLFYFSRHSEKNDLLTNLEHYIASNGKVEVYNSKIKKRGNKGRAFQSDILKRLKVEQNAVKLAFKHYGERYGATNVKTVELEKKGWDLEVRTGNYTMNIEVKGNSGSDLVVQLTPREYSMFKTNPRDYQLFVVNNALERNPIQRIFEYQPHAKVWIADDKSVLKVKIIKSAVITL